MTLFCSTTNVILLINYLKISLKTLSKACHRIENKYALKPPKAFEGLLQHKQHIDLNFKQPIALSDKTTKLVNPAKSYAHVGTGVYHNYTRTIQDPRLNTQVYGNCKPQLIAYSASSSNLLFN